MEKEKICTKCGEIKLFSEFHKFKLAKHGIRSECKKCSCLRRQKYRHTKRGLINSIYNSQKNSSKIRGHKPPDYTEKELEKWLLDNKLFHILFDNWAESGYKKSLIPSCDRTEDSKGYDLTRLNLMTWIENKRNSDKAHSDGMYKNMRMPNKPVVGIRIKDGNKVEFISVNRAAKELKTNISNISSACRGVRKNAGGYTWKFKVSQL